MLVNNAGYSQSGAVESVPLDEVRRQFETNVFGLVRMCQLVLPAHARAAAGADRQRLLDGRRSFTFPGGGFYHATKYAVEAISDALRFEVKGFGVDVVDRRARAHPHRLRRGGGDRRRRRGEARGPVRRLQRAGRQGDARTSTTKGPLRHLGGPPEAVAKAIERAITSKSPRIRYRVTPSAHVLIGQRRADDATACGTRFVRTQFPSPGAQ